MDRPTDFVDVFGELDRARLTRMDEPARQEQLAARQLLHEYVEGLWEDVRRSGERPDVGEKYRALTVAREFARSLRSVAFDAVYDVPSTDRADG